MCSRKKTTVSFFDNRPTWLSPQKFLIWTYIRNSSSLSHVYLDKWKINLSPMSGVVFHILRCALIMHNPWKLFVQKHLDRQIWATYAFLRIYPHCLLSLIWSWKAMCARFSQNYNVSYWSLLFGLTSVFIRRMQA